MRLIAQRDGPYLRVEQDGGYSPEARVIMRGVASGARCEGGVHWTYPYTMGAVLALKAAASLLPADLSLSEDLQKEVTRTEELSGKEHQIRKVIQRYMDDPSLAMAPYVTSDSPTPWRHQSLAYHWGVRVDGMYLAHKPGLGKTRSGSDIIRGRIDAGDVRWPEQVWVPSHWSHVFPDRPIYDHWGIKGGILIVAPNVVLGTWVGELKRWQGIDAILINSKDKATKIRRGGMAAWVHVISYGSLESVEDNEYDGIIADEAHYLACEDTKLFARLNHLRTKAKWCVAMSGTQMSNMLPSLWAQYYWLDGGRSLGASRESFERRYFEFEGRKRVALPHAEKEISHHISRITYYQTMQEAFPDKPRKIQQVMKVPMSQDQQRYYEDVRTKTVTDVLAGQLTVDVATTRLLKLLQVCQGFVKDDDGNIQTFTSAKLRALRDMITGQGDLAGTRTLVWVRFRHDQRLIVQMLRKAGIEPLYLHGDMNQQQREYVRDQWNSNHRHRVLVGMIQLGIGINLHAPHCVDDYGNPARCSTTIFYGMDWRVTQLEQAMDRVYRGDQVESCLYRYLLSEALETSEGLIEPLDVRVYETLMLKMEQAASVSEESIDYIRRLLAA